MIVILQPDDDAEEAIAQHQQNHPDEPLILVRIVDPIRPTVGDVGHA